LTDLLDESEQIPIENECLSPSIVIRQRPKRFFYRFWGAGHQRNRIQSGNPERVYFTDVVCKYLAYFPKPWRYGCAAFDRAVFIPAFLIFQLDVYALLGKFGGCFGANVDLSPEKAGVGGSIPSLATN